MDNTMFLMVEANNTETEMMNSKARSKEKKSQRSFRMLAIAFGVTVAVLILIFILLWMLVPRSSSAPSNLCTSEVCSNASALVQKSVNLSASPSNLCTSEVCISASALLQKSVNLSANPCQDFFSFACGGTLRRSYNPTTINQGLGISIDESAKLNGKLFELFLKPDLVRSEDPDMNKLYQLTRQIFMSCISWHDPTIWWLPSLWKVNTPAFSFKELTKPLISEINAAANLEGFMARLVKTGSSGLITLSRYVYAKRYFDYVTNGRRRGPVMIFQAMEFQFARRWNATDVDEMKELFRELGLEFTGNSFKLTAIQAELFDSYKDSDVFVGTVSELQQKTKEYLPSGIAFNWTSFINNFHSSPLNPNMEIAVPHLKWFCSFLTLLSPEQSARNGSYHDFIILDAVMSLNKFLPIDKFTELRDSYTEQKFLIDRDEGSREYSQFSSFCVKMAMTAMPPVVFDMFKKAYVTDNFALIDTVTSQIEEAMRQNVDDESWILSKSRDAIKDKIRNMKRVIAHHELPQAEIKALYKHQILLLDGAKHFGDTILMYQDATLRGLLWFMTSEAPLHSALDMLYNQLIVNAFYFRYSNSIHIILGILGTYLYNKDYPEYLLYGGIGNVIGHEISHGFDPDLHLFNGTGVPVGSIFDPTTLTEYNKRVKCLVDSYSQLMLVPNVTVNGKLTVGDNFADIVGINAAFRAYKNLQAKSQQAAQLLPGPLASALSPDQLFFVQAAQLYCEKLEDFITRQRYLFDVHSPPRARVFGMMSQSKEFSSVFGCKPGDKMHLKDADKCHIW